MKTTVMVQGQERDLARNLMVAYKVQGCHNHKPYAQIFQEMADMPLEQQVEIIYTSFQVANKELSTVVTKEMFLEEFLEQHDVSDLMDYLSYIMEGIMGKTLLDKAKEAVDSGNVL